MQCEIVSLSGRALKSRDMRINPTKNDGGHGLSSAGRLVKVPAIQLKLHRASAGCSPEALELFS